jgi:CHAT domain-containing protein
LGPVADLIPGKRLIVVADGKLNYLPLAALPFPNAVDRRPILQTNEIDYEPSAAVLLFSTKRARPEPQSPRDLLVFSDPVYSNDDPRISPEAIGKFTEAAKTEEAGQERGVDTLEGLFRLPASFEEGETIAEIIGRSHSKVLSGFAANRDSATSADMGHFKVVHFATHGLIDDNRPELSGLVLSRFDETGHPRSEMIRLQDIYGMALRSDLVVLSACKTGVGKEIRGEGLMSLNVAFLQAGAKSVVSSLWKVDDRATHVLMEQFYRNMAEKNLTTADALRQAQLEMSEDPRYSSPFYWAAFVIHGDFRGTPGFSTRYTSWICLLVLPALVFLTLYRKRIMALLNGKAEKQF